MNEASPIRLFLAGDVMTGRGIDQAFTQSVDPRLYEPFVRDANEYVELAEAENGPIDRPLAPDEIWGEALDVLERSKPHLRMINLETAITDRGEPWPGKGIHYRMHPANASCLDAADIDCCVLANNHLLDWGRIGLADTCRALDEHGIAHCGAGANLAAAQRPAELSASGGRVLVFACGHASSGIPADWAALEDRPGVWRLPDLSRRSAEVVGEVVSRFRREGDRVIVSVHVGDNWGYTVDEAQRRFARALVDRAGADIVHAHSSHHPRPMALHDDRLILHGCGDLINDYEGIGGHQSYRPELVAMYFTDIDPKNGRLLRLELVPMRIRRFRLERVGPQAVRWMAETLNRAAGSGDLCLEVTNAGTLLARSSRVA